MRTGWMRPVAMLLLGVGVAVGVCRADGPRQELLADAGWRFTAADPAGAEKAGFDDAAWRKIDLPHDWSVEAPASEKALSAAGGGYAQVGVAWYRRAFAAPVAWQGKRVTVEFEGVAHGATVYLNGEKLGEHPYAYTSFRFDLTRGLKLGEKNVLAVRVNTQDQPASRWYEGTGIYRHVHVVVTDAVRVAPWGVFASTAELTAAEAKVVVKTRVENTSAAGVEAEVKTLLLDAAGKTAAEARHTGKIASGSEDEAADTISLAKPAVWSPEHPALYRVRTEVRVGGKLVDETETSFGVRTLSWSVDKGLLLNGKSIKLLGGSVHHDNGPLGAAAFDRAEERRVELLKAAGFNAVRTAHNPPSPAFLDACDRLGMLVLDEPFDVWITKKVDYDYARLFNEWWRQDLDSMVMRDRNHPSIIFWGIGNEIPDVWTGAGTPIAAKLSARVRELDPTRPLTQAFPGATFSANADAVIANVDVAGYNYNILQNGPKDHQRVPGRIMMTTESMPAAVFDLWKDMQAKPYVLGEFVWTAMDYLGESGIGAWQYGTPEQAKMAAGMGKMASTMMASMGADGKAPVMAAPDPKKGEKPDPMMQMFMHGYPWHAAACGDLDLTGWRKPQSYYREIVWHGGDRVYATVRLPEPEGKKIIAMTEMWSWIPSLPSWTWPGQEGKPMQVEVFASTEKVRLYLNGKLVGEKPTGLDQERKTIFDVPYEPGTLKAVGMNGEKETAAASVLETAGAPARLVLKADRKTVKADGEDLVYVTVELEDAAGRLEQNAADEVSFTVEGPATLAAVANGDGQSTESYQGTSRALFQGHAQAILRAGRAAGSIRLTATVAGVKSAEVSIGSQKVEPAAELEQ